MEITRGFHGSRGFKISPVGSGRRVGSRGLKISWVGSCRVKRFGNLAGRVESDQEVWKSRGSGRVMTREIRVTPGSSHHDPRVVFV